MNKFIIFTKKLLSGSSDELTIKELCDTEEVDLHMKAQWEAARYRDVPDSAGIEIFRSIEKKTGGAYLKGRRNYPFIWISVAAAIMLIAGTGFWLTVFNIKCDTFLAESDETFILPDSSSVLLRRGSFIKYEKAFLKNREVELQGEAVFNIRKNPHSVFSVKIGDVAVQVKGTVFKVKHREGSNDEICLFEGCVEIKMENDQKIIMKPGQKLIFDKLTSEITIEQFASVGWQEGKFFFDKACLSDLIAGVNLIFGSDIKIGFLCSGISFTGSVLPHESLEDVIEKICFVLNLKYDETSHMLMKVTD